MSETYRIGIPIVDKVDLLDVCNAVEIFRWMNGFWKGHTVEAPLIGKTETLDPVTTGNGVVLEPDAWFGDFSETDALDALYVPGGGGDYVTAATKDADLLAFVAQQAHCAKLVTSVCTGAFILAAAKLLDGRECTTHWFFHDQMRADYPKARLVNGYPRYVKAETAAVVTGGGISSAIDESLYIVSLIAGDEVAKCIQLAIQYHPSPPFTNGDPCQADFRTWARVMRAWGKPV
jgi:cyclohexyl-isocyanide hydratase